MAYGPVTIAGGTTGVLDDIEVLVDDLGASGVSQGVKLIKGTAGSSTPIGVDAEPLVVKNRPRGTADYDSGRVAVTTSAVSLTTSTVYVNKVLILNASDVLRTFTLQNTADAAYFSQLVVAPRETRIEDFGWMAIAGLEVLADANSAVICQIVGST